MKKPARIPAIKMIKVISSNIESIGYDAKSFQLFVKFKATDRSKANTFVYEDVNHVEFNSLLQAESVGKVFNSSIRSVKEGGLYEIGSEVEASKADAAGWISVDNNPPKTKTFVLGWVAPHGIVKSGGTEPVIKIGSDFYDMGDRTCTVTHWMPLPEPPTA